MKKAIVLIIVVVAAVAADRLWLKYHGGGTAAPAADKAAPDEEDKVKLSHDADGNVVIGMSDDMQGDAGIEVGQPEAAKMTPEMKAYGEVMDPAPLAALLAELAADEAAYEVSSNELARRKVLEKDGNTSVRDLQTAQAAALKDETTLQSARDRLALTWGGVLQGQTDLPAFQRSLASMNTALVRVNLPQGESLSAPPLGASISTLSGEPVEAQYIGPARAADPLIGGQAYVFMVKDNAGKLLAGQPITAALKLPGDPVEGVIVPRRAIVRITGSTWFYFFNADGESFTRKPISLDHRVNDGWFVSKILTPEDHIVVTGAQTLLSQELKATIQPD